MGRRGERERERHARRWHRGSAEAAEAALAAPAAETTGGRRRRRRRRELTPEEITHLEARRAANRKVAFLGHLTVYGAVCVFLLLVAGFRPAFIVAMSWGIGLSAHWFFGIVAPDLRKRLVDREVEQRIHTTVSTQRRELQDRHLRTMEELSASIAHEIRNPITAAKSLVQQMGEDPGRQEQVEYAKVALDELDRVERSISHLLRYAREEDLRLHDVRMRDIVESALESLRDRFESVGAGITCEIDSDGQMRGDDEKLRRVVINLVGNALDALEQTGVAEPRIELSLGENLAGSQVWVRVRDNGPGIDPERLHRIFSPFYTSKQNGTGLGLAISKKLVDAHGGSIEAHSAPGSGTEFVLTFPKRGNGAEGAA